MSLPNDDDPLLYPHPLSMIQHSRNVKLRALSRPSRRNWGANSGRRLNPTYLNLEKDVSCVPYATEDLTRRMLTNRNTATPPCGIADAD